MQTPAAALAWELWRRNRARLIAIAALLFGFVFIYPRLCAWSGVDLGASDDLAEFTGKFPRGDSGSTLVGTIQVLFLVFLAGGPVTAMLLSLLCVTWMFTFVEFHPNAGNPVRFPIRLFTLPVSTSFLFFWLFLGGLTVVATLFACWHYLIPRPHFLLFGACDTCLGWLAFLAVAQGITWALASWPITRLCVLMTVLFGFVASPAWPRIFQSPAFLPALAAAGAILGRIALGKMRQGQWQGWTGPLPLQTTLARAALRGPKQFASPAQAQFWFEWRRFGRALCIGLGAFALAPVFLHVLARRAFGWGPVDNNTLVGFALLLAVMPPAIYFCFTSATVLREQSFAMLRPLTNGEMVLALLKAAAASAAWSWAAVILAFCLLPFLGDMQAVERTFALPSQYQLAAAVSCLMFLTWRILAVELCFGLGGHRWLSIVPWLKLLACWGGIILFNFEENELRGFAPFIPWALGFLVALKLFLAWQGFRKATQRGLLARSAVFNYLAVWALLVAGLFTLAVVLFYPAGHLLLPLSLAVVLLAPLARIGFCPLALESSRHA